MPDIKFANDWQGQSPQGPNHESSLNEDEMKALVMRILLIPGITDDGIPKHDRIKELVGRLQSENGAVIVNKGIHERDSNVHFTINVSPQAAGALHVWVEVGAPKYVPSAKNSSGKVAKIELFSYQPVGISVLVNGIYYNFPAAFKLTNGRSNRPIGRPRGTSFSVGNTNAAKNTPPTMAQIIQGLVSPPSNY